MLIVAKDIDCVDSTIDYVNNYLDSTILDANFKKN